MYIYDARPLALIVMDKGRDGAQNYDFGPFFDVDFFETFFCEVDKSFVWVLLIDDPTRIMKINLSTKDVMFMKRRLVVWRPEMFQ